MLDGIIGEYGKGKKCYSIAKTRSAACGALSGISYNESGEETILGNYAVGHNTEFTIPDDCVKIGVKMEGNYGIYDINIIQ